MSSNADLVLKNFAWRIGAIAPTDLATCREGFEKFNPGKESPRSGSGWTRRFYIEWLDSGPDIAATCDNQREAWHFFRVHVYYVAGGSDWEAWQALVLQDRHKIRECLRAQANPDTGVDNRLGYDDSHSTTDIGLYERQCDPGDELNKENEKLWRYSSQWRCKIRESEL